VEERSRPPSRQDTDRKIPSDHLHPRTKTCPVRCFKLENWLKDIGGYDYARHNIHGTFAPLFRDNQHKALKAPALLSVDDEFYEGNLLLLPGSTELSFWTPRSGAGAEHECRNFGAFRKVFNMIATSFSTLEQPLQFIIVDLGPTVDNINKAIVMSSDYILPPVFADYFSASSVHGLLYRALPKFLEWQKGHKFSTLDPSIQKSLEQDGFYSFKDTRWPKVLPFLVQQYNLDKPTKQGEQVEQVKADFVHSIRYLIEDLRDQGDAAPEKFSPHRLLVPDGAGEYVVPFCKNLVVAPALSHTTGVPLVHLADKGNAVPCMVCETTPAC